MNLLSRPPAGIAFFAVLSLSAALAQSPPVINSFTVQDPDVFLGGRGTFQYDVTGGGTLEIDQGVGAVGGTSVRFSQTQRVYVVPRGATWSYLSDGSDQGASDVVVGNLAYGAGNWKHPDFDDAGWLEGPGELGYGDSQTTDVGFVDVDEGKEGVQKNATTYYRTTFSITAGEIASLENLFLEMRRDDGAIVYLNGVEIVRMSVGDGVLGFDTYTAGLGQSAAGGGETTFFECQLSPGILAAGDNTLAVEIHQTSATSSDTRFDLGLFQKVTAAGTEVFGFGSTWRVKADGSNLGDAAVVAGEPGYDASNWKHPAFDDASWTSAAGDFGYDVAVLNEATILRFGPNEDNADNDGGNKFLTSYFRTSFELGAAELAAVDTAAANLRVDDGAILYINGVEVARDGVDEGEITSASTATGTIGGGAEATFDPFVIDPAVLVEGTNTIAVEIHQASATSSDVSFDMSLTVTDAALVTTTKLASGSEWRYLDDAGASLADSSSTLVAGVAGYDDSNWKHPDFDDSAWRAGVGEFGYGDTGLTSGGHLNQMFNTVLDFGPDPANKFTTSYFRRDFTVDAGDLASAYGARILARVDDGAIVYLNGVEVWRGNMPANPDPGDPEPGDPVDGTTFATRAAASDGRTADVVSIDKDSLLPGANTIAVEVHQSALTSTDVAFALAIELVSPSGAAVTYTLTATNEFGTTTATTSATSVAVPATPVYLSTSNAPNVGWHYPEVWSDKMAPHAGAYVAYGQFDSVVRTPAGEADPVFGGDSLTLVGPTAGLILVHASGTASVPAIDLAGGQILNGSTAELGVGGVGNSIVVSADSLIGTVNAAGAMTVSADLSGSGGVWIPASDIGGATIFTGDNTGYSGIWLADGIFAPSSQTALGSGPVLVSNNGTLDPGVDFIGLLPNLLLISAEGTVILDRTMAFATGSVSIDGNVVPDGEYSATQLDDLGYGGVFTGDATLFVGSINPDSDRDDLLDSWELMFFDTLMDTDGSGDADGDGQTDEAEFLAMTDPTDPLDFLKITSVTQAPSGDVTITWTSKVGVSYGVRFGDLSSWQVIATGQPGNDAEIDFTDDGTQSGGAPGDDDERYYQVFVE